MKKENKKAFFRFITIIIVILFIAMVILSSCQKTTSLKSTDTVSQLEFKASPLSARIIKNDISQIKNIDNTDKILILAPHPDDETIGVAGIIQKALKAGAEVNIVCLTNGDSERNADIHYKNIPYSQNVFLSLGELRRKETINALIKLGLKEKDVKFLGYPDAGTLHILLEHWGSSNPYKNYLTGVSYVPYSECYLPGSKYIGENILNNLESIIKDFNPTKIFVSSPFDMHSDHRAFYLFLRIALWDLKLKINNPKIYTYLTHYKNWPDPKGYYPEKFINPPIPNINDNIKWLNLNLSYEEVRKKYESTICYKSQLKFGSFLISFARKNELFAYLDDINLKNNDNNINQNQIIWDIANYNNLYYSLNNNILYTKIITKQKIDKNFNISIYFLGYNNKIEFSKMPKIQLKIDKEKLKIFNKNQEIYDHDVNLKIENNNLIIGIPLSLLQNPQYILNGIETQSNYLSNSLFGWRVIGIS
ncbi:MAG: PIG-L family deacetylase [Cyanobacteria bacterium]|nr:PIG-L family deacetylase [Cyanobacteriota bacterium]